PVVLAGRPPVAAGRNPAGLWRFAICAASARDCSGRLYRWRSGPHPLQEPLPRRPWRLFSPPRCLWPTLSVCPEFWPALLPAPVLYRSVSHRRGRLPVFLWFWLWRSGWRPVASAACTDPRWCGRPSVQEWCSRWRVFLLALCLRLPRGLYVWLLCRRLRVPSAPDVVQIAGGRARLGFWRHGLR